MAYWRAYASSLLYRVSTNLHIDITAFSIGAPLAWGHALRARLLNPFCGTPIKLIKCQHINKTNPYDQSPLACHIDFITGRPLTSCDDLNTQSRSPDSSPKQALSRAINISKSPDTLADNDCEHEKRSNGANESEPNVLATYPNTSQPQRTQVRRRNHPLTNVKHLAYGLAPP